jgi:hypothetical protein
MTMRKLFLITSIVVAATSAQATQTRGLLLTNSTSANTHTAQLQAPEPKLSVADQLKAIGETPKPAAEAAPIAAPAPQVTAAPAPVPTAPVASTTSAAPVQPAVSQPVEARAEAAPAKKPVKTAKAHRRETDEQKARRIAGRYGISW